MRIEPNQLRVKRFILQAMPSMGAQYRRTLTSQLRGEDIDRLLTAAQALHAQIDMGMYGDRLSPEMIAPLLTDFVQFKAEAEKVKVPAIYGSSMDEMNLSSFILELEFTHHVHKVPATYIVAGYISDPLPSEGEKLDANTTLTINSLYEYRESRFGPAESPTSATYLTKAFQALYDPSYEGLGKPAMYRLAPEDVVSNIAVQDMLGLMGPGDIVDMRTMQTSHPTFVEYASNDPTIWGERLLDANVRAARREKDEQILHTTSDGRMDYLAEMGSILRDDNTMNNPFIRAMAVIRDGRPSASFTVRDLLVIDTDCTKNLEILPAPEVNPVKKRATLEDNSVNTIAGHYILNSVPAIMAKHGIRIAEFGARNFFTPARIWPSKIQGIHGEVSHETIDKFLEEVRIRVMDVISFSNTRSYHFGGCFDLFGISGFAIELDREGNLSFLSPTFANSLFSPQLTNDRKDLDHNGQTFDELFKLHKDVL